jgi:hypothetical protein
VGPDIPEQSHAGASDPAEQNPVRSDTLRNHVLWGIRQRETTLQGEYLDKFKTEFEYIVRFESDA